MYAMKILVSFLTITLFYCNFSHAQANQLLEGVQWKTHQNAINALNQAVQNEIKANGNTNSHLTSFSSGPNFRIHFYNAIVDRLKKSAPEMKVAILESYKSVLRLMAIPDDYNTDFAYNELGQVVELLKQ